ERRLGEGRGSGSFFVSHLREGGAAAQDENQAKEARRCPFRGGRCTIRVADPRPMTRGYQVLHRRLHHSMLAWRIACLVQLEVKHVPEQHRRAADQRSISASALRIASASRGRTRRATSRPSLRNTSVGHSFTANERPRRRWLASATLMWRTPAWLANASSMSGCARRQWPHHGLPNSRSVRPASASIAERDGSVAAYSWVEAIPEEFLQLDGGGRAPCDGGNAILYCSVRDLAAERAGAEPEARMRVPRMQRTINRIQADPNYLLDQFQCGARDRASLCRIE